MFKTKNISPMVLILMFLLLLIIPNIVMLSGLEDAVGNNENRKHQSFPELSIKTPIKSISAFKSYYTENFGLKSSLVNNYLGFKNNVLKENPFPNRIVKGKNNWVFLGNQYNNTLNDAFGNETLNSNQLNNAIKYLEEINDYFKSKNIAFYLVVPPDKNKIYKEFLPYQLNEKETRFTVFKDALKNKTAIHLIDLYDPLINKKTKDELYIKTDSHWNSLGAFIGYNYAVTEINKTVPINIQQLGDYRVSNEKTIGDAGKLINIKDEVTNVVLEKLIKSNVKLINGNRNELHYINPDQNIKLMMHRDSFSNAWINFFNESFGETKYLRSYNIDKNEIEKFKPDVVIFEIIERNIELLGKNNLFIK